jgi:hypothetical protein
MAVRAEIDLLELMPSKDRSKYTSKTLLDIETPLVLCPCEYVDDQSRSAVLMITFGAIYVFKTQLIGSPVLWNKVHLLDCLKV